MLVCDALQAALKHVQTRVVPLIEGLRKRSPCGTVHLPAALIVTRTIEGERFVTLMFRGVISEPRESAMAPLCVVSDPAPLLPAHEQECVGAHAHVICKSDNCMSHKDKVMKACPRADTPGNTHLHI